MKARCVILPFVVMFLAFVVVTGQTDEGTPDSLTGSRDHDWYWLIFPIAGLFVFGIIARRKKR